ncbi:MAG TPA: hypothetical protein VM598_01430 [Bdellovibrionota bacterium]|nr:hypothetical protein [Bdellovibrionota bacterium]
MLAWLAATGSPSSQAADDVLAVLGSRLCALMSRARPTGNTYYDQAKDFAQTVGFEYAQWLEARIPKEGKTTIAVVMGGGEHVGTLLREYLAMRGVKNVIIQEVWINRSIAGIWQYKRGRRTSPTDFELIGFHSGAFDKPVPTTQSRAYNSGNDGTSLLKVYGEPAANSPAQLLDYTDQLGLWKSDNLLVVDTGFKGATADALALLAAKAGFQGNIRGALYSFNPELNRGLSLPVEGFTTGMSNDARSVWAYALDSGFDVPQLMRKAKPMEPTVESMEAYFEPHIVNSFQRSRPKVTALVQGPDGKWVPNQEPYKDPSTLAQLQSVLNGIRDGLRARCSWSSLCRGSLRLPDPPAR